MRERQQCECSFKNKYFCLVNMNFTFCSCKLAQKQRRQLLRKIQWNVSNRWQQHENRKQQHKATAKSSKVANTIKAKKFYHVRCHIYSHLYRTLLCIFCFGVQIWPFPMGKRSNKAIFIDERTTRQTWWTKEKCQRKHCTVHMQFATTVIWTVRYFNFSAWQKFICFNSDFGWFFITFVPAWRYCLRYCFANLLFIPLNCQHAFSRLWPDYQSALTYKFWIQCCDIQTTCDTSERRKKNVSTENEKRNSFRETHKHQCKDHNVFYDPF